MANFIKYPRLVRELLDSSEINKNDLIVEIGPGKGIITKQLAERAKEVIGVEKDEKLYDGLRETFENYDNVKIINQDFLEYKLPRETYKVVANIPFEITAKIINRIIESPTQAEMMYLVMQEEAAEKFAGTPHETQSSILTKPWYEVEILGEIDRTNFTLKPQVRIVYARFVKREKPFILDEDKADFRDFVIYGFNQWQPTMTESYKKVLTYDQLKTLKKTLKLGELKPSEVSFDNWLLFFKTAKKIMTEEKKEIFRNYRKSFEVRW